MHKFVLAASLALALGTVSAAQPMIGKLSNVEGLVSIGGSTFVANAGNGSALTAGSTVTVSTRGKATVILDDGCVVPLRGGQFLSLDPKLTCSQLVQSVAQLSAPYRLAQGQGAGGAPVASGGLAAGGTGAALIPGVIMGGIVAVGSVVENNSQSGN